MDNATKTPLYLSRTQQTVTCFLQAAESVSAAADAVTSTVGKALQGSVPQGLQAPVPKSVARANAAKVRGACDSFCVSRGCCMLRQGCCMLSYLQTLPR